MSERTESFSTQETGKVVPGRPADKKEKVGKMSGGRTARELSKKEKESSISRLSQKTMVPSTDRERHEGELRLREKRAEGVSQAVTSLSPSMEGVASSSGTASCSAQEIVETNIYPDLPIPGQPKGPFTIQERMRDLHVPGVSIAVINDGKLEWYQGYNELASQGSKGPDSESMLTQLGSIGKMFTSLTVLSLIEKNPTWFPDGLDTDVSSILKKDPDLGEDFWKNFDPHGFLKSGHKVTIRLLLSHRAGIVEGASEYYDKQALAQQIDEVQNGIDAIKHTISLTPSSSERESLEVTLRIKEDKLKTLQEIYQKAVEEKIPTITEILEGKTKLGPVFLKYKPGERFEYSNPGFGILQKVVEIVTRRPFLEVVKESVLDKAGMTETTYDPPFERKIHWGKYVDNCARSCETDTATSK